MISIIVTNRLLKFKTGLKFDIISLLCIYQENSKTKTNL